MQTNLIFNLEIGLFHGDSMTLDVVLNHDTILSFSKFDQELQQIRILVNLPTKIDFILENRHTNDTEIDIDGKILQDKYVHFKNMHIFNTNIESWKMGNDIILYHDNHGNIITPSYFWNRNGKASIEINESDPLLWLLNHQEIW